MNAAIFLRIVVIVDKSNSDDVVVVGGGNGANFLPLFLNGGERRSDGATELLVGIFSRELRLSCSAAN